MTEDALAPTLKRLAESRYDNAGWDELYRQLWPVIVATLSRKHGLSAVMADDLAQEVMIRILKNAKFSGVSSSQFRAYVNTICRSVVIDSLRKMAKFGKEVPFDESLKGLNWQGSVAMDTQDLQSSIADLSQFDRRLLDQVLAGRRPGEIAEDMNARVGTVHVWLHRLRARLRESLSRHL